MEPNAKRNGLIYNEKQRIGYLESDMNREEVKIDNVGYTLLADWYETPKGQVLLVLPGFTSTKKKYEELIAALVSSTGYSALVLDYAGHGKSPFNLDDLSRADNFSDVVAAFDWLVQHYSQKKITVLGTSYGGFHSVYLTKFRTFENIIFRVPASYPEETLYTKLGEMKDGHSREYRHNPDSYIDHWLFTHTESVKGRALLVTHEFDTVCPPVATTPFAKAFDADTWEAPGFRHGFGESDVSEQQLQDYYKKLADWINNEG